MSDISQAIFDLWTLRDSKVWPDGAPELVFDPWTTWVQRGLRSGQMLIREEDAALYRCLRLLQWHERTCADSYGVFVPGTGIVPWEYMEPDQIVAAAMEIVQGWEDKK